ncbi:hypothetical protein WCE55_13020 [Luteimonas sp. MJ293]|uniref:hypothetical protein n=1 Tax=Luteimonas sp. MJ146 TaxID=3129240 RepID=UPI0031BBA5D0
MKRILRLERHLPKFDEGALARAAINLEGNTPQSLARFGFVEPFDTGQMVLPSVHLGPTARRNSGGYEIVHRDQPMEEIVRLQSWRRKQYHGRDRIEVEDFIQRTYRRYPRSYMPGHGIEFTIMERSDGTKVIASPAYDPHIENEALRISANLLLEGFGEVQFVRANLVPPLNVPVKRLNWDLFPQGHLPWRRIRRQLDQLIERAAPPSVRPVIHSRIDAVELYGPDFAGIGRAGFQGYWVFGFTRHRLFVLESRLLDNATYILGADWETVSRMTKAEVINGDLAVARLIHDQSWYQRLDEELRHVLPLKAA